MGKQYSLESDSSDVDEIKLNRHGDVIKISGNDAALFDKYVNGYNNIMKMANEMPEKLEAVEKELSDNDIEKAVALSRVRVDFCNDAIRIIDNIFGDGTAKKYFCDYYESNPDFLPDEDLFVAFLETMTPIMEDIFNRKIERQEKASKARMEKYKPQDFQKPQRKSTKGTRK